MPGASDQPNTCHDESVACVGTPPKIGGYMPPMTLGSVTCGLPGGGIDRSETVDFANCTALFVTLGAAISEARDHHWDFRHCDCVWKFWVLAESSCFHFNSSVRWLIGEALPALGPADANAIYQQYVTFGGDKIQTDFGFASFTSYDLFSLANDVNHCAAVEACPTLFAEIPGFNPAWCYVDH
jgi:hypothetical protein